MRFHDRRQAGQELARLLSEWAKGHDLTDPLVLALPRGGVPVAAEIARALNAPLDLLVVRKIGLPGRPEVGIGAIAGDDPPLFDQAALAFLGLTKGQFASEIARQRTEIHRLELLYRERRPAPRIKGRTVILVDDGLATGVTARAALTQLRRQGPARLVLAVPVCSDSGSDLRQKADDVICAHQPPLFQSVGEWYDDFEQLSDREVIETLRAVDAGV
jgi:predicted phosphoribosyltransferase